MYNQPGIVLQMHTNEDKINRMTLTLKEKKIQKLCAESKSLSLIKGARGFWHRDRLTDSLCLLPSNILKLCLTFLSYVSLFEKPTTMIISSLTPYVKYIT